MPARATIFRRADGALAIHSPLAIDDELAKEIAKVGEVRALVAPSCIHYRFLADAIARYPRATVLGAPGLEKKISDVVFAPLPSSGKVEALGEGVRVRSIDGSPSLGEHLFFHEASRSLIVTDFMFNVHRCRSFGMKLVLWFGGAWKRPAQSKLWRFATKDRAATARSISDVLGWEFDRVIVAHGDVLETSAKDHVRRAVSWLLRDSSQLLGTGANAT